MARILSKREKAIVWVTIGAVVISIAFNFIIEPVLSKNADLNKEIELTRIKLAKYLELLRQKDSIQEKYSKFSETLQRSNAVKNASVNVLAEIENLANEAKIQIIDIRPETAKAKELYKESLIELRTEGNIESYFQFLFSIENSPLLLTIKNFQLNARPNSQALEGIFSISQLSLD